MADIVTQLNERGVLEVAEQLGLTVRRLRIDPCPACQRSEKRGAVYLELSGRWRCPCGAGGRAVDLVMAREGLDQLDRRALDAIERLLGRTGEWERVKATQPVVVERPSMTPVQVAGYWRSMRARGNQDVARWLFDTRGMGPCPVAPEFGVLDRARQVPPSRPDIRSMIEAGPACCWALRTTHPERRGEIRNIQVRPIVRGEGGKNRLFVSGPGSASDGLWPLCYGDPLELDGRPLLLVEGGCDWMTARGWMPGLWAVLGAYCAGDIRSRWPMVARDYPGRVLVVPHLDAVDQSGKRAGPEACESLIKQCPAVELFDWRGFWGACGRRSSDLNDMIRCLMDGGQGMPWAAAGRAFRWVVG